MKQFETGKRYKDCGITFEVMKRTAKTVTVAFVSHAGRFNESLRDTKRVKIQNWPDGEVIFYGPYELHAAQ